MTTTARIESFTRQLTQARSTVATYEEILEAAVNDSRAASNIKGIKVILRNAKRNVELYAELLEGEKA